jgi:sugar lactone lactonase YvrE
VKPFAVTPSANSRGAVQVLGVLAFILALALAMAVAPARGATTHQFETSFGADGLTNPFQIALDNSDGTIYVADRATGSVLKFANDGSPEDFSALASNALEGFEFASTGGQIAVDNSGGANDGNLYVAHEENPRPIEAFDPSGEPANFTAVSPYVEGNALVGVPANSENPSGDLDRGYGVAVDASGNIYVASNSIIYIFAPSGEFITEVETGGTGGVSAGNLAVDAAGDIYVISAYSFVPGARRFTPSSFPPTPSTTYAMSSVSETLTTGIAVDPGDQTVYIDENGVVTQFDSAANGNARLGSLGSAELSAGSSGVAVDRSGGSNDGSIFVGSGEEVARFGPTLVLPDVTAEEAEDLTTSSATLAGTVNPLGIEVTECFFEYGISTSYGDTAACEESGSEIGSGTDPVEVHADLEGLAPGNYHFRLVAANANGAFQSNDATFAIIAPPVIGDQAAVATETEAELRARVNPSNGTTTYFFEYGTTAAYGSRTPEKTLAAGIDEVDARGHLLGLTPGGTYHYRLVVSNSAGEVDGGDRVFTTEMPEDQQACANADLRIEQGWTRLPDCRGYEMVSVPEKNGNDVGYGFGRTRISPDGGRILYSSAGAFAGAAGTGLSVDYLADRTVGGWSTESIAPPQEPHESVFLGQATFDAFSQDLSKAVLESADPVLGPGAEEGGTNLYLRDNDATADRYQVIAPGQTKYPYPFWREANDDLSAILFESREQLLPEAPAGVSNLYLWKDGELSLPADPPGPAGNVAPEGSVAGTNLFATYGWAAVNAVSEDGSRVAFGTQPEGFAGPTVLYQRDGDVIHKVSAPQRPISGPDPAGTQSAKYLASNEDGSRVFFLSNEKLTEDSTATGPYAADLYMYESGSGELTDLTVSTSNSPSNAVQPAGGSENEQTGLIGLSDDGSYIYYQALRAPDGTLGAENFEQSELQRGVFVWHDGVTRQVGVIGNPEHESADGQNPLGINNSYVTPDGRHLLFLSSTKLTERETGGFTVAYKYDYSADQLECISCPASGLPTGDTSLSSLRPQYGAALYRSHYVSDDGARTAFQTPTSLVSDDANGKRDVYLYEGGRARLISTGESEDPSTFADMTPDGSDVLFVTREQISPRDEDPNLDVYDARVNGGIPDPIGSGRACDGDACQPSPSSPPTEALPGSNRNQQAAGCDQARAAAAAARRKLRALAAKAARAGGSRKSQLKRQAKRFAHKAKRAEGRARRCEAGR